MIVERYRVRPMSRYLCHQAIQAATAGDWQEAHRINMRLVARHQEQPGRSADEQRRAMATIANLQAQLRADVLLDEDLIAAVQEHGPAPLGKLAAILGLERKAAAGRLGELVDAGRIVPCRAGDGEGLAFQAPGLARRPK